MITQEVSRYPHRWAALSRDTKLSRKHGKKVQCSCCNRLWPWDDVEVHHTSYEGEGDRAGVNIFPVCGSKQDIGTCHHWVHQKGNWMQEDDTWQNRNTPAIVARLQHGYAGDPIGETRPWLGIVGALGALAIGWFMMSLFLGGVKPVKRTAIVSATVNIRQGPGVAYAKSGKPLTKGATVEILEEKNGWVRIKGLDDRSWIAGNFTKQKNNPTTR